MIKASVISEYRETGNSFIKDLKSSGMTEEEITLVLGIHQKNYEMQYLDDILPTETHVVSYSRATAKKKDGVQNETSAKEDDNVSETSAKEGDSNEDGNQDSNEDSNDECVNNEKREID